MIHTRFINTNNNIKLHFRPGIKDEWRVVKVTRLERVTGLLTLGALL